jgi:pilus assembly protein CpaF
MTATFEGARDTSPLAEIERRVQERAKRLGVHEETRDGLRAIVEDEVERWNLDHQRGLRPFGVADPESVVDRALRNLGGYGPLAPLLIDDDVWEIEINAPDAIFVKRHSGPCGFHDEVFHDDEHVVRTLTRLLDDAPGAHRKLDPAEGLQDARLEDGSRVHIVHADVARGGHVLVNIRKFTGVPIRSLDELVMADAIEPAVALFLRACIRARASIVFAGAPGAGKTTLLSCCLAELDPSLRVVVAEEVFEADIALPNVAQMQTRPARADRPEVDLRRLVAGFLRMAPDVAVVGEVRDREALSLLLALSSGVTGYTTIHASSATQALSRLRFLSQLSDVGRHLPFSALSSLVSEAVDIVVHTARTRAGIRVTSIVALEDLVTGPDSPHFTVTEVFAQHTSGSGVQWTGDLPTRLERRFAAQGLAVRPVLGGDR